MKNEKVQMHKMSAQMQFETVSPATKLLQKRRKMYQVHEAFEVQKQQFKKQQETFKGVEQDIRNRDLQIQVHLINFCQFLQENDSKKKKAIQRFKQEQDVYDKKKQQINKLQQQIEIAHEKQKKFDRRVTSLKKYEQYLQKVRTNYSDQYAEMSDILSRYQTLKKFNQNLLQDRKIMQETKQKLKKQSNIFEKQINRDILQLNNEIKQLSKELEGKLNIKQQLQSQLQRSRNQYQKKNLDLAKILLAVDNLYLKCDESNIRIKHNYEQHICQTDNKKIKNRRNQDTKNKQDNNNIIIIIQDKKKKQDQENNVQLKCKITLQKLKSIFAYTKDYKTILQEYKKNPQKK